MTTQQGRVLDCPYLRIKQIREDVTFLFSGAKIFNETPVKKLQMPKAYRLSAAERDISFSYNDHLDDVSLYNCITF